MKRFVSRIPDVLHFKFGAFFSVDEVHKVAIIILPISKKGISEEADK